MNSEELNSKNIPQIRFKGFNGNWEEKNLGKICEFSKGHGYSKKDLIKKGTQVYLYGQMYTEYKIALIKSDKFVYPQSDSVYSTGREVILPASGETPEDIARATAVLSKGIILGGDINIVYPPKDLKQLFLALSISYEKNRNKLAEQAQGATISHLHGSDIAKLSICYPLTSEQSKIESLFSQIDSLITSTQKEHDKLVVLKKSMLQKMFPKKGSFVPEIRFDGFNEEWTEQKLGDLGKTISGIGFPEKEQGGNEGIPFFKISDMNNSGNEIMMIFSNNYVTNEQIKKCGWKIIETYPAVIFAKVGAAIMLNRKRLVLQNFLIDNNTMAYVFNDSWDTYFGKILFDSIDLTELVQIGALPSYNGTTVEKMFVKIPSFEEQQKIGSYFQNLDKLISKQFIELEKLKNIKNILLKKMFV